MTDKVNLNSMWFLIDVAAIGFNIFVTSQFYFIELGLGFIIKLLLRKFTTNFKNSSCFFEYALKTIFSNKKKRKFLITN